MTKKTIEPTLKVLTGARDLLEKGWTQRASARGSDGCEVDVYGDSATHFCSLGAIDRSAKNCGDMYGYERAKAALYEVFDQDKIVDLNDSPQTKQEHILMMFDLAILNMQDKI